MRPTHAALLRSEELRFIIQMLRVTWCESQVILHDRTLILLHCPSAVNSCTASTWFHSILSLSRERLSPASLRKTSPQCVLSDWLKHFHAGCPMGLNVLLYSFADCSLLFLPSPTRSLSTANKYVIEFIEIAYIKFTAHLQNTAYISLKLQSYRGCSKQFAQYQPRKKRLRFLTGKSHPSS